MTEVIRLYGGDDGESHFERVEVAFEKLPTSEASAALGATSVQFRRSPVGHFIDWHHAPCRQYVLLLQGQSKVTVGDGTTHTFVPGEVLLAEDLTGRGHTTESVGDVPRVSVFIPLSEQGTS